MTVKGDAFELPADVKTVFFRVAQESLTNITKHADATAVDVVLDYSHGGVTMTVRDNGSGFDIRAVQAHPSRGIGLRNMRERLQTIGGSCDISSRHGCTVVEASVPSSALLHATEA